MKMLKRTVAAALLMALLLALLMPAGALAATRKRKTTSSASVKEYEVTDAAFTVQLNPDGSADVVENWTVNFIKGSFSRFYKDVYRGAGLATEERFSDLDDLKVSINGQECEETDDTTTRSDYHYNLSETSTAYTISAYRYSLNEQVRYRFSYTLKDVVKQVDGNYWLFVYRFIGANFEKAVGSVSIEIKAPRGGHTKALFASRGRTSADGNTVKVTSGRSKGMFKVRMRIDGNDVFAGVQNLRRNELSNLNLTDNQKIGGITGIIAFLIGLITAWRTGFLRWLCGIPARKRYRRDPDRFEKAYSRLTANLGGGKDNPYTAAIRAACLGQDMAEIGAYFFAGVAALAVNGQVKIEGDAMLVREKGEGVVDVWGAYAPGNILNKLMQYGEDVKGTKEWKRMTFKRLLERLSYLGYKEQYDLFTTMTDYYCRDTVPPELHKDAAFLRRVRSAYIKQTGTVGPNAVFSAIEAGTLTPRMVFDMIYTNPNSARAEQRAENAVYAIEDCFYDMQDLFESATRSVREAEREARRAAARERVRNSSHDSSCSSCSSCGGGGAD